MILSKSRLVLYGLIILIGSVIALPSLLSSQQLEAWPGDRLAAAVAVA